MKSVMLAFLLFGYMVRGECPSQVADCIPQSGCEMVNGVCTLIDDQVTTEAKSASPDDDECSPDGDWNIDYVGKSTQFKLYNPCGKFIKIKMEDLTEFDAQTDTKTNNKETSFASTKDWEPDSTVDDNVITARFASDSMQRSEAKFSLLTQFARNDVDVPNEFKNGTVTIKRNQLKFSVNISNFIETDGNYAVLCIGIMTNSAGDFDLDDDNVASNGGFAIDSPTEEAATCGSDVTDVLVEAGGNGNNQIDLCYTFAPCFEEDLYYDPLIRALSDDNASSMVSVFVVSVLSVVCVLFV